MTKLEHDVVAYDATLRTSDAMASMLSNGRVHAVTRHYTDSAALAGRAFGGALRQALELHDRGARSKDVKLVWAAAYYLYNLT